MDEIPVRYATHIVHHVIRTACSGSNDSPMELVTTITLTYRTTNNGYVSNSGRASVESALPPSPSLGTLFSFLLHPGVCFRTVIITVESFVMIQSNKQFAMAREWVSQLAWGASLFASMLYAASRYTGHGSNGWRS